MLLSHFGSSSSPASGPTPNTAVPWTTDARFGEGNAILGNIREALALAGLRLSAQLPWLARYKISRRPFLLLSCRNMVSAGLPRTHCRHERADWKEGSGVADSITYSSRWDLLESCLFVQSVSKWLGRIRTNVVYQSTSFLGQKDDFTRNVKVLYGFSDISRYK
jgi:hypothetical protein